MRNLEMTLCIEFYENKYKTPQIKKFEGRKINVTSSRDLTIAFLGLVSSDR